jgi:hypothetical protein
MNTLRSSRLLLVLLVFVAAAPARGQSCASVAGTYSGTETYDSRLTFGGMTDTLNDSETVRSLTISQNGCTFTYTLQFPGGSPSSITRTGTLRGNEIVALSGPIAIGVDPGIKITRNQIVSSSGTVSEGQIVINMVGVAEGTYQGMPGRLDVQSRVVLTGPAAPTAKPAIAKQPEPLSVRQGSTATFSVTATGSAPLAYLWRKGGKALANDARISGASSNVLTIVSAQPDDAGLYSVEVKNSLGVATSANALLTVLAANTAPTLTGPSSATVVKGATLVVANTATDPDLPPNSLTFELLSAPAGVELNPATGVLTWTPTEAQGPATNTIVLRVTDNGTPPLSATNTMTVIVRELRLRALRAADGVALEFETLPGHTYRLESCDDLAGRLWNAVAGAEAIAGTGNPVRLTPPSHSNREQYFRLLLLP